MRRTPPGVDIVRSDRIRNPLCAAVAMMNQCRAGCYTVAYKANVPLSAAASEDDRHKPFLKV